MNAIARVAVAEDSLVKNINFNFYLPEVKVLALVFLLIVSAFGVLYVKDLNRRLFMTHQELQSTTQKLNVDSNKLLLEQSAWSTQARVQLVAHNKLQMRIPPTSDVVMIKL